MPLPHNASGLTRKDSWGTCCRADPFGASSLRRWWVAVSSRTPACGLSTRWRQNVSTQGCTTEAATGPGMIWGWKSHSVTSATLSPRPFQLHQMATSSLWSKCHGALGMAAASTFPSPRLASPPSLQPHLNPPLRVDYSKEYCSSHGGRGGSLGEGVTSSWQQERKAEGREREGARTHFFACWLSLVVLVISLSQRPIWWDTRLGERGSPGRVDH